MSDSPASSEYKLLSEVVDPVNAKVTLRKDPSKPYVGLENIPSRGSKLLSWEKADSSISTNSIFTAGDVLFGKLRPNLRKCVAAPFDGYCSTDILVLRAKDGIAPDFAVRILQSEKIGATAERSAIGTKMPRTAWEHLSDALVFCPEITEQRKVACVLDTLDVAIQKTEAMVEKMRQVKQGLLHDLLTRGVEANGELRPSCKDAPELYKALSGRYVPLKWDVDTLVQSCALIRDGTHLPPVRVSSGPLLLSVRNMKDGKFVLTEQDTRVSESFFNQMHRSWSIQKGDVLLAIVGATIGKIAQVGDMPKFTLQRSVAVLRGKDRKLRNDFLFAYLGSYEFQTALWRQVNQTAQPGIYLDQLGSISIPLPPDDEQELIIERLYTAERKITLEDEYLKKLKKQKTALVDDLLAGGVRVTPLLAQ